MRKTISIAVFGVLAACGSSQKGPVSGGGMADDACGRASAKLVTLFETDTKKAAPPELAGTFARHCRADAWSAAATTCIGNATTPDELDKCEGEITEDQQSKLKADLGALLDKRDATPAMEAPSDSDGDREGGTGMPAGSPAPDSPSADPCDGGE